MYTKTGKTYMVEAFTVRFNEGGAGLQCIKVNGTVGEPLGYFEIEEGTEVLGSLRTAISQGELPFHINVTVLGLSYQTQAPQCNTLAASCEPAHAAILVR